MAPVVHFLAEHPLVAPLVVVVLVLAWLASRPLARQLGCGRRAAGALLVAAAVPVAMTLSPSSDVPGYALRWCVTAVRPVSDWGRGGEELANMVMLAPLGLLAVVLLDRSHAALLLVVAAVFPFLVEAVQYAAPSLGRTCETTDVLLNLTGLLLGLVVGLLLRLLDRARRAPGHRRSASPGT